MRKLLLFVGISGAVGLIFASFAAGTPEMAKKEGKQCIYCHTAVGKPDLNEAGKYYKDHGSLDGFREKKP